MPHAIGIDLGATNTLACVWRGGDVQTIHVDGRPLMPSFVSIRSDGSTLVGQAAKSRAALEPGQSITSIRRHLGDGKTRWEIGGKSYTPVDVSALLIARVKEAAEVHLGERVSQAVITIPGCFSINQRQEVQKAGETAGLEVLQLLPEPTATAVSYGLDKGKDQTILVYDLGGSAFDISVIRMKGNRFEVLAVDGDPQMGGDDFTILLTGHLVSRLKGAHGQSNDLIALLSGKNGTRDASRKLQSACQRLKDAAEIAKIELSENDSAPISLSDVLGCSLDEEAPLKTYNRLIEPLVEKTIGKIRDVLKASRLTASDIDRVLLVGGSSRNKLVRERVADAVKEPFTLDRMDESSARGASIVAADLSPPGKRSLSLDVRNVVPFSVGFKERNGTREDGFHVLIPKNNPLPISVEHTGLATPQRNQRTINISLFEGEYPTCKQNLLVGCFRLEGIPPAGQPKVAIRLGLNVSGLLALTATCLHPKGLETLRVVSLEGAEANRSNSPEIEIIFLLDSSGGMHDELEALQRWCQDRKVVVGDESDYRWGLVDFDVPYGAGIKRHNWDMIRPTTMSRFAGALSRLRIGRLGGCGSFFGSVDSVRVAAAFAEAFSTDTKNKIGILISDEAGNNTTAIRGITEINKAASICLHVVGVPGSCHETLASASGGQFWDIEELRSNVSAVSIVEAFVRIVESAIKVSRS